jgi:hypothetical protein
MPKSAYEACWIVSVRTRTILNCSIEVACGIFVASRQLLSRRDNTVERSNATFYEMSEFTGGPSWERSLLGCRDMHRVSSGMSIRIHSARLRGNRAGGDSCCHSRLMCRRHGGSPRMGMQHSRVSAARLWLLGLIGCASIVLASTATPSATLDHRACSTDAGSKSRLPPQAMA